MRVGVIGAGNVGSALVAMLLDESRFPALIEAVGAPLRLVAVAVRDTNKPHPGVPSELLTSDALSVATRDDVDLLVELAGASTTPTATSAPPSNQARVSSPPTRR